MELRQYHFYSWLISTRLALQQLRQSVNRLLNRVPGRIGSKQTPVRPETAQYWREELCGNELIRLPGWFEGSCTVDGVSRSDFRLSLHPSGGFSHGACEPFLGSWRVHLDRRGRVVLSLISDSGKLVGRGRLDYDPEDPGAVLVNGRRYLRRFARSHLGRLGSSVAAMASPTS